MERVVLDTWQKAITLVVLVVILVIVFNDLGMKISVVEVFSFFRPILLIALWLASVVAFSVAMGSWLRGDRVWTEIFGVLSLAFSFVLLLLLGAF